MHIHSLAYQPARTDHRHETQFNRQQVQRVTLIANHGIEGDHKAGRHPDRQVNIVSWALVQSLAAQGWQTAPGQLGEQIVIRGLDGLMLVSGMRLQLGDEAIIEITKPRTSCQWLSKTQGQFAGIATGTPDAVGVFARVITGGVVSVGDASYILNGQYADVVAHP